MTPAVEIEIRMQALMTALGAQNCNQLAKALGVSRQAMSVAKRTGRIPTAWFEKAALTDYASENASVRLTAGRPKLQEGQKAFRKLLGARLRALRGGRAIVPLAARLCTHPETYTRYERGIGSPNADVLAAICREFQVDAQWLLTGSHRRGTEGAEK